MNELPSVSVDTHALFWYFTQDKRLPEKTRLELSQAARVYIPTIVLLELIYLLKRLGQLGKFSLIINKIKRVKKYSVASLDLSIVEASVKFLDLEMHDSIIVATAQLLKVPLVTKDQTIRKIYPNTIW